QVWRRTVLDGSLVQGHALACADLLGLDRQQVVAGWRGTPKAQDNIGIKLYTWNAVDNSWKGHWIDEGGMATEDLKIADLNGDGKLDIVAAGRATKNVKIYWNQSTLGTKPELAGGWKKHVVWKGHAVHGASAGDFNGDGKMDIAFSKAGGPSAMVLAPDWRYVELYAKNGGIHSTNMDVDGDGDTDFIGGDRHVFWLENPGGSDAEKGDWHYRVVDSDITGVHHVLEADVNQDGKLDLIANEFNPAVKPNGAPGSKVGDSIIWYETPSDIDAEWRRHIFANGDAGGGSHYMGIGDLDGDGDNDISAGAKGKPFLNGNWFAWWENTGEETWKKHILAIEETAATCAMPADLDGDGDMDVFATRGHDAGILWFENQGGKKFELHRIDNLLSGAHCLTVNDLDGDGDIDAATTAKDDKRTVWFENDGKGNFTPHDIDDDQAAYDIRSVDMDGDGDLDLLVAGQYSQNVVWYENQMN
ncbi:MAG: VCBS repeat-containing protein, partial [Verrucomicrobiota bacterium]